MHLSTSTSNEGVVGISQGVQVTLETIEVPRVVIPSLVYEVVSSPTLLGNTSKTKVPKQGEEELEMQFFWAFLELAPGIPSHFDATSGRPRDQ